MSPEIFLDNNLCNFEPAQLKDIFDAEGIKKLPENDFEIERIRLLSQYMVGNISDTFDEIKELDKHEQKRVFLTWAEVVKDSDTLRDMLKQIAREFIAK